MFVRFSNCSRCMGRLHELQSTDMAGWEVELCVRAIAWGDYDTVAAIMAEHGARMQLRWNALYFTVEWMGRSAGEWEPEPMQRILTLLVQHCDVEWAVPLAQSALVVGVMLASPKVTVDHWMIMAQNLYDRGAFELMLNDSRCTLDVLRRASGNWSQPVLHRFRKSLACAFERLERDSQRAATAETKLATTVLSKKERRELERSKSRK